VIALETTLMTPTDLDVLRLRAVRIILATIVILSVYGLQHQGLERSRKDRECVFVASHEDLLLTRNGRPRKRMLYSWAISLKAM
jgi:hypothetical protein